MNQHIVRMLLVTMAAGLLPAASAANAPVKPAAPAIEGAKIHLVFESEKKVVAFPEKGVTAIFSGGAPLFVDAKKGKGLAISSEGPNAKTLVLDAPGVFSFKQGTLAFWFKPLVTFSDEKKYYLFSSQTKNNAIQVFEEKDRSLMFLAKKGDNWPSPFFNFSWSNRPNWQKDQWYHVAITWGPDLPTKFYVDGVKIQEDTSKPDPGFEDTLDKIYIGNDYGGGTQPTPPSPICG